MRSEIKKTGLGDKKKDDGLSDDRTGLDAEEKDGSQKACTGLNEEEENYGGQLPCHVNVTCCRCRRFFFLKAQPKPGKCLVL